MPHTKEFLLDRAKLAAAVCDAVLNFRQNGTDPFGVTDIMSAIAGRIDGIGPDTAKEIKRILDAERRHLNIREAGIGGQLWTFGHAPRARSRLIGS